MFLFLLLYVSLIGGQGSTTDALVAGGPGLALQFQRDGEHAIFEDFSFGLDSVGQITVEMWLLSNSMHSSFTPFSYSVEGMPQRWYCYSFLLTK